MLLIGFWFDGGLFKLATAASFWILLDLGQARPLMKADKHGEGRADLCPQINADERR